LNNELKKAHFSRQITPEASFTPHMTIGRWSDISTRSSDVQAIRNAELTYRFPLIQFKAAEMTLFNSTLSSAGPEYTALKAFKIE